MDACLPDWNTDLGADLPLPLQRKPLGLENELVELLWQNGEIVLHSPANRKQSCDDPRNKSKHVRDPTSLIQDDETSLWIDCPIDESFERDFCYDFLSDLPSFDESHKPSNSDKFDLSGVNHVVPTSHSQHQEFVPLPLPPLIFQAKNESSGMSRMTVGSSNCASNQVMDVSWASSCGIGANARSLNKGAERETYGQAATSCSGGSGQSNDTTKHKRKSCELEESECPSDATESESAAGNKATARRTRIAEVHNLTEKKRRDRINEKMKALQELIPHSNKSDKASMLDDAIEYMKSLELQIQLMWMGRGMGPMMFPGMHPHTPRGGMAMLPAFQTRGHSPMVDYQTQMQNYMALYSMENDTSSPQATNMFNFGLQQSETAAPRRNGSRSVG